ncbi:HAD-like domain-containing protein [Polychytrium aggregatum]|uniref:HAD-like domain-containing protein n=1 Tax=Polychytrium aggregatum TaxID=110093 RepID=UPI0022FE14DF|nr:HAD-like domain-containing protein [Polychytrium aggregatum]KAI9197315.1 HAD-like domain-containing protein [Polychytrium aggregatum]
MRSSPARRRHLQGPSRSILGDYAATPPISQSAPRSVSLPPLEIPTRASMTPAAPPATEETGGSVQVLLPPDSLVAPVFHHPPMAGAPPSASSAQTSMRKYMIQTDIKPTLRLLQMDQQVEQEQEQQRSKQSLLLRSPSKPKKAAQQVALADSPSRSRSPAAKLSRILMSPSTGSKKRGRRGGNPLTPSRRSKKPMLSPGEASKWKQLKIFEVGLFSPNYNVVTKLIPRKSLSRSSSEISNTTKSRTDKIPLKDSTETLNLVEDGDDVDDALTDELDLTDEASPESESDGLATRVKSVIIQNATTHMDSEDEDDDYEAVRDEFDPYEFIRQLGPVCPDDLKRTSKLLPSKKPGQKKITLLLDLDETLVHCKTEPLENHDFMIPLTVASEHYEVYGRIRPFVEEFLEKVSQLFEVVVFTASLQVYADLVLDMLDKKKNRFQHRLYRDSCTIVDGVHMKDLEKLGRNIKHTMLVDNSPQVFALQLSNGIPIKSWYDDQDDHELLDLLKFLETVSDTDDVRPHIDRQFKLKELIWPTDPTTFEDNDDLA